MHTHMSCEFVFCPHLPSDVEKFISRPTETGLKMITNGQTAKNARNSNFLSSICCVPNLWTKTMATKATYFPALVYRTSSLFEDRLQSHILQFLRTLVLFSLSYLFASRNGSFFLLGPCHKFVV